jgi:hypothetical protein
MALEQKDLEQIERLIYKNADDIAVSIARSFERMEERVDAAESRLYGRMSDLEDAIEESQEKISGQVLELQGDILDLTRKDIQSED